LFGSRLDVEGEGYGFVNAHGGVLLGFFQGFYLGMGLAVLVYRKKRNLEFFLGFRNIKVFEVFHSGGM